MKIDHSLFICSSVELKIRDFEPELCCAYGTISLKVSLINKPAGQQMEITHFHHFKIWEHYKN